ncbi:MAG: hypothetical protein NZO16_05045 [Deltaproteobacteria bacterium]|nr:hypothetical protein [Deltaproteobacteria bacterium]
MYRLFLGIIAICLSGQEVPLDSLNQLADRYLELKEKPSTDPNLTQSQMAEIEKIGFTILTGLELDKIKASIESGSKPSEQKITLSDLFSPLLAEIQKILSKPREIIEHEAKLSTILNYESRLTDAKNKTTEMISKTDSQNLRKFLKKIAAKIDDEMQNTLAQKALTEAKLLELKSKGRELNGVFSSVRASMTNFFKAILGSVLFFLTLKQLKNYLEQSLLHSFFLSSFWRRLILVALVTVNVVGTILLFLLMLYVLGEWFLFAVSALIIIALCFLSKRLITDFFSQAAILLNLGFVREGEMIFYLGLPFRIKSLGFVCLLDNPLLENSTIRVPLTDLLDLRSFKIQEEFNWFNANKGEFVFLDQDAIPSRITNQTIEAVCIEKPDKTQVIIPTVDFFKSRLRKIGDEFSIFIRASVSNKHLREADDLVLILRKTLEKVALDELTKCNIPDPQHIVLNASFLEINLTSLDFGLSALCKKVHANYYATIRRVLMLAYKNFVNENNLELPGAPLTLSR